MSKLKALAEFFRRQDGLSIADSVELAAEDLDPYRELLSALDLRENRKHPRRAFRLESRL